MVPGITPPALLPASSRRRISSNNAASRNRSAFTLYNRSNLNTPRGVINDLSSEMTEQQRKFPFITIGLYLAALSLFIQSHLSIVFLTMEPKLVRRLDQFGIYLTQASQVIDHHGQRAVYFATRDSLLMDISHFRQDYRGFYFFINDCLRTYP